MNKMYTINSKMSTFYQSKLQDLFSLCQQQIVMNQQKKAKTKPDYVWINREDYGKEGIQQQVDQLAIKQSDEAEYANVLALFSKVLHKSMTALVYFNEKTGEMSLHSLPHHKKILSVSPGSFEYSGIFGDSRNYFWHGWGIEKKFGERGFDLAIAAVKLNSLHDAYTISYKKRLGERLDNYFCTNADEVGLSYTLLEHKYAQVLDIGLYRESRHNFLSPYQDIEAKDQKIFGQGKLNAGRIKHSNLLSLKCNYKWKWLNLNAHIGTDFGNKSHIAALNTQIKGDFQTKNTKLIWSFEAGNVWGNNVLPNDLLFRNKRRWAGSRSRNFISPRLQLHLLKFPYLSMLNFSPYFYGQSWGVFSKKQGQKHMKFEAEYGVGISSDSGQIKFDINLFQLSTQKFGGEIGSIKFSF